MSNEIKPIALHGHTRAVTQVKYNREGDLIFSSGKDGIVSVWRTSDGERLGVYEGHSAVAALDVNRSSTLMATAGNDLKTFIYNVQTGKALVKIDHLAPCRSVGFSYDDSVLFCNTDKKMGQPGMIQFFNLPHSLGLGEEPKTKFKPSSSFKMPDGEAITYAEFGPTNETIYFTLAKGGVGILDVERGVCTRSARPHSEEHDVVRIHFDTNYYTCITASKDQSAKLLDPRTLQTIQTYTMDLPCNDASVSSTTDHVIIGGGIDAQEAALSAHGGFSVRFYHKVHEDLLGSISCHFGTLNAVQFHPDGVGFATGAVDGFVKLFTFGEGYKKTVGAIPMWPEEDKEDEEEDQQNEDDGDEEAAEEEDGEEAGDEEAEEGNEEEQEAAAAAQE